MRRPTRIGAPLVSLVLVLSVSGCSFAAPATSPSAARTAATSAPASPARSTSSARPTPAAPIPTSTRPGSTPSPAPAGPDRTLKTNSIYGIDLDDRVVRCQGKVRSPQTPLKNSDLAPYLRTVVKCLVSAFAKPLADQGFTLTTPKVKTYGKRISTPCGKYGQDVAPAYYCSATQTIYWPQTSDDGREAFTIARLGYVGLIAHEFGHHLQATTGMLNEYGQDYYGTKKKGTRYALSRRLELQAQCFEGVFLAVSAKSIKLSALDRRQIRLWHGYTGDEDPPKSRLPDHGSSAAQLRWLERGLDSADFGRCNTWKVKAESVK